jgi:alpha-tubulin suppressor-like RCC1 family protein
MFVGGAMITACDGNRPSRRLTGNRSGTENEIMQLLPHGPLTTESAARLSAKLDIGKNHNCVAFSMDDNVYCSGLKDNGRLGLGFEKDGKTVKGQPKTGPLDPVIRSQSERYLAVAAGAKSTAVLTEDHKVYNFGLGLQGQVPRAGGKGKGDQDNPVPERAIDIAPAFAIAGSHKHFMIAQLERGMLFIWGQTSFSKGGASHFRDFKASISKPKLYTDDNHVVYFKRGSISASPSGFCGILSEDLGEKMKKDEAVCVGANRDGEFGKAQPGVLTAVLPGKKVALIRTGGVYTKAKIKFLKPPFVAAPGIEKFHTVIVTDDGKLFVSGANESGQLLLKEGSPEGMKTKINEFTEADFGKGTHKFIYAALSGQGTAVLDDKGHLYFAGLSKNGEAGIGIKDRSVHVTSEGELKRIEVRKDGKVVTDKFVAVAGGDDGFMAVDVNGYTTAWGDNTFGEIDRDKKMAGTKIAFPHLFSFKSKPVQEASPAKAKESKKNKTPAGKRSQPK